MKPKEYLDAQEKRSQAIEILKDKMLELTCYYIEYSSCIDEPYIEYWPKKQKKHGNNCVGDTKIYKHFFMTLKGIGI